ncbi:MAG: hypothetical protein FJ284_16115 [Planctomycetes bacterium]|nr:hypothetical protein [Planctomycetota bacterium]
MIRGGILVVVMLCLAAMPANARSQQLVVQQPTFQQFTTPSTVLVPDRGATGLGGIGSSARGRTTYGPIPLGTARAGSTGASRVRVRAWVHDFQAMDEAILAGEHLPSAVSRRSPTRPTPTLRPSSPMRLRAAR